MKYCYIMAILIVLAAVCCYVSGSRRYDVKYQVYFPDYAGNKKQLKGFGIYQSEDLDAYVQTNPVVSNIKQKVVDYGHEFVYITENGHLIDISYGAESVGYANIIATNTSGFELSIIRGPRNRPLKAVSPSVGVGP